MLPDDQRARVRVVDVPYVEGGIAASVAAETGADLAAVAAAAESARTSWAEGEAASEAPDPAAAPAPSDGPYERDVLVRNPQGLHARPAADFVKLASTFPAKVTVNGKDAKSLLGVMSLGLTAGSTARIASDDPAGTEAVDALVALVETGFGEV